MRAAAVPHRRRLAAALLVSALAATGLPRPAAAAGAPELSVSSVPTGEDFAAVAYGDPFDFANPQDLRLLPDRTTPALHSPRMESGEYRFDARGGASLTTFVFPGYPGALSMERDGGALPIDADRYTHLAMRIFSPSQRAMSFSFDRCLSAEFANQFCRTSTDNVILEPGWNTVVRDLRALTTGRQWPWAGKVYAFRMMNDVADGYRVGYLRLQTAPETVEVTWDRSAGTDLYWDADTSLANNTPDAPGWGRLGGSGTATFPAGAMEAGTYAFYARTGSGTPSAYSAGLRVAPRPAPVVLDPDLAGGEDYATVANGKPWDFSTPADVIAQGGFTGGTFGPGGLQGTNSGNDPFFYLRMNQPLDASRYHRLTVHATYDGAFNLADTAGGGTHGRLLWTRADRDQTHVIQGNKLIESRELVHYPGQSSFTVDLKTPPDPALVMETDRPERDGWSTGSPVTHLRYDPNEDRGARRWRIARIELRATDATSANAFDIRWRDDSGATGVKVTLSYRPESGGAETAIAGGIDQQPGVNTYRWDTAGVAPGRYVVRVTGDDGVSRGSGTSTGPVDVRASLRTAGSNRIATGVALSRLAYPGGAGTAVLARADGFADALAAAPLAAAADGPLLLNAGDRLDPAVAAELDRLKAATVFLLGGESAQSSAVEAALEASTAEDCADSPPSRKTVAAFRRSSSAATAGSSRSPAFSRSGP
ncbi:MAG TPA: cell wall-binding repeat-containing protein, partial [Egibacteraceae bacterium]|nr:cell wall-binding repeat-containing protein [Egibacteraceae bacterium]